MLAFHSYSIYISPQKPCLQLQVTTIHQYNSRRYKIRLCQANTGMRYHIVLLPKSRLSQLPITIYQIQFGNISCYQVGTCSNFFFLLETSPGISEESVTLLLRTEISSPFPMGSQLFPLLILFDSLFSTCPTGTSQFHFLPSFQTFLLINLVHGPMCPLMNFSPLNKLYILTSITKSKICVSVQIHGRWLPYQLPCSTFTDFG